MKRQVSESDSEMSAGRQVGEETLFRVRVNMTRFFEDERALAYVCVRTRRRVHWLERRLCRLFALPPRLRLLSRGHLLPPAEPLAVLRPDDPVDVLPAPLAPLSPDRGGDGSDAMFPAPVEADVAAPEPHTDPEHGEDDELCARKLSALRMLEQYCGERSASSASRPRRRRVRRRRRAAPYDAGAHDGDGAPAARDVTDSAAAEDDLPQVSSESLKSAAGVLRNGAQKSRVPRVVRPLSDGT